MYFFTSSLFLIKVNLLWVGHYICSSFYLTIFEKDIKYELKLV